MFDFVSANREGTKFQTVQGANGSEDLNITDGVGIYMTGLQNATGGSSIGVTSGSLRGHWNVPVLTTEEDSVIPTVIGQPILSQWQVKIQNTQTRHIDVNGSTYRGPSVTLQDLGTTIPAGYSKLTLNTSDVGPPDAPYYLNFDFTGSDNPDTPGAWSLPIAEAKVTLGHTGGSASNQDFLFDTGAQVSVISRDTAAALGILAPDLEHPDFTVEVLGVGGIDIVPGMYINSLSLLSQGGGTSWNHVPVLVLDVGDPRDPSNAIPGIIGMNLFNDRDLILNMDVNGTAQKFVSIGPRITPEWINTGGGLWSEDQKWSLGAPDGPDLQANFLGGITSPSTVTVDAGSFTVGSMKFDNANRYTIAGPGTIRVEAFAIGESAIDVVSGSHTISAPMTIVSPTTINVTPSTATLTLSGNVDAGSVALTKTGAGAALMNNVRAGTLTVNGGTIAIAANGTSTGTSRVKALALAGGATPTATLDLNDNDLIVTSGTYGGVTTAIAYARNGGLWDRRGLTSTAARNTFPKNKTLGTLTGTQYLSTGTSNFDGFTVAGTDVLVKYTYYGDTDFNGLINFDDYSRTDGGFNSNGSDWFHGDFDYNGIVNFDDYALIDAAFNSQNGSLRRAMAWLGGDDRSDQGMDLPALQLVQRHFAQFGQSYANAFLNAVPEPGTVMIAATASALSLVRRRRNR